MNIRKLDQPLDDKAEGYCGPYPYTTELAGPDGVSIHFWTGTETPSRWQLVSALRKARGARDIVRASWSHGFPSCFWTRQDIK